MDTIQVTSEEDSYTCISNNFIEYYMADANGDFVKLYLYLAMLCSTHRPISISDIADNLNCTDKDVCRGIRYWIKEDALRLHYNENKEVTGIVLLNLKKPDITLTSDLKVVDFKLSLTPSDDTITKHVELPENVTKKTVADVAFISDENDTVKAPRKKQPTPAQLNDKLHDSEIHDLINEATAYCNSLYFTFMTVPPVP